MDESQRICFGLQSLSKELNSIYQQINMSYTVTLGFLINIKKLSEFKAYLLNILYRNDDGNYFLRGVYKEGVEVVCNLRL